MAKDTDHDPMSDRQVIEMAIARFPAEFGLRAFPGERFRISEHASYLSRWGDPSSLQLYTQRLTEDGTWRDFAKGTEAELADEVREP